MIAPLIVSLATSPQEAPPDFILDDMVKTAQAVDLFPSQGNTLTSPANIMMVTIMVAEAADEPSRLSILNSLEPRMTMPDARNLFDALAKGEEGETTFLARAVWSRRAPAANVANGFREVYGAEVGSTPSQQQADAWAQRNTNIMIKNFPVNMSQAEVVFASALAYINRWKGGEKRSIELPFQFSSGPRNVKGFQLETSARTVGDVSLFYLPYANGDGMIILFSNGNAVTPEIVRKWGSPQWKEALHGRGSVMRPERVLLKVPNFEFEKRNDYLSAWVNRGRPGSVNFPGLAPRPTGFFLKEAAFIRVDEKGTEAASVAAGGGGLGGGYDRRTVVLDRPFVFAIVRPAYPLPLFVGTVNEPTTKD